MNLTKKEALILQQLVSAGSAELYGLEMVRESAGELKLGSIYVTLGRLEDKGFVESHKEKNPEQVVPRRLYKITSTGARVYRAWSSAMSAYESQLLEAI
jgi:DNA-binding PadR family transcriptional regulator